MNMGVIILFILISILILSMIITIAFQKSIYHAYRESLRSDNIDEAIIKGRSYYLSISKKNRKLRGITDVVQIDARVKQDYTSSRELSKHSANNFD